MLTFILKKEWFDKIKRGEKTVEYREMTDYWKKRIEKLRFATYEPVPWILFRKGYTKHTLLAVVNEIWPLASGRLTDLHTDKPVYAIKFKLVTKRETK